jgi:tyrosine-specific transport protein
MMGKNNRFVGAILLVAGTTIGAGMLALPITTGLAGFFPSLLLMTLIWLFMLLTAFYLLEVNLHTPGESNLISMIRLTLGPAGTVIAWVTYLLLLYALTSAYLLGCSQILDKFFQDIFPFFVPHWAWLVAIFCIVSLFVYLGTTLVDYLNRFMMLGLVLAYLTLAAVGCCYVTPKMLTYANWDYFVPSVTIVLTSFGFHIIIPTLTTYLEHDVKRLKWAIFIGSLIPFIIYVIWQFLVMGVVPVYGDNGLLEAGKQGLQITFFLTALLKSPLLNVSIRAFAFFAIVTSLLGVSLSLSDFLADGLKIKKTHLGKLLIVGLTFLPPLLFALFYPHGFIIALEYAGLFVLILLCLLPSLMVWRERYSVRTEKKFEKKIFQVPGGKVALSGVILLSLFLLGLEVFR